MKGPHAASWVPIGRLPSSEEYAGACIVFASRRGAAGATGAVLNVDGGLGIRGLGRTPAGGLELRQRFEGDQEA